MTIKSNLSELKAQSAKASKATKPNIYHIVKWYEERKVAIFKSALNSVLYLIHSVAIVNGRAEKAYNRVVARYGNTIPATGKIAREIEKKNDSGDGVQVQQPGFFQTQVCNSTQIRQ